jgi:GTP diphosphokinase / guanosine-3',5'-bis(diphosphate) 3'-diphosphatase
MSNGLLLILRAAESAAHWHSGQKRKGMAGEPYINHLIEVARLAAEATGGSDPNLIAAAFLHDAVEDQKVPLAGIAAKFGEDVASLVRELTDDKSLPKAERKRLQVEHAPFLSARAKVLKLADKISNVRAIGASPPADWSAERRRDYIQWGRDVVAGLGEVSPPLQREFAEAADAAGRAIGG